MNENIPVTLNIEELGMFFSKVSFCYVIGGRQAAPQITYCTYCIHTTTLAERLDKKV